jgi:hypothetical protein
VEHRACCTQVFREALAPQGAAPPREQEHLT